MRDGCMENEKYMSASRKRISERSRGAGRERGGCGGNRGIDSTRDMPGCFRGLNGSSTTFDNFDNANYKTRDRATTSGSSLKISSPAEQSYMRNPRFEYSELFTDTAVSP